MRRAGWNALASVRERRQSRTLHSRKTRAHCSVLACPIVCVIERRVAGKACAPIQCVNDEQRQLFSLARQLPARLTSEQVAWLLNCQPYDIPVLITHRHLKPLGNPLPSARKYFAATEIMELMQDRAWLNRVTTTLQNYWQGRNGRRRVRNDESSPDFASASTARPGANGRRLSLAQS